MSAGKTRTAVVTDEGDVYMWEDKQQKSNQQQQQQQPQAAAAAAGDSLSSSPAVGSLESSIIAIQSGQSACVAPFRVGGVKRAFQVREPGCGTSSFTHDGHAKVACLLLTIRVSPGCMCHRQCMLPPVYCLNFGVLCRSQGASCSQLCPLTHVCVLYGVGCCW